MQISEELVKQITNAVLSQMSQSGVSSSTGDHITAPSSGKSLSLAGRERINEEKTSYASYPRAKKGTDPKEVVIGGRCRIPERDQKNHLRHPAGRCTP